VVWAEPEVARRGWGGDLEECRGNKVGGEGGLSAG